MKRLDLYLGRRMLCATALLLLLFTLASLLLVRRENLALDWRWLAYFSLPPAILLGALYTLESAQRLGEARAAATSGLSGLGTWRSLIWVSTLACLVLAALPPGSREPRGLFAEALSVPAGSGNRAWIGEDFLVAGKADRIAEGGGAGLLLVRYGARPRILEAPRVERDEGRLLLVGEGGRLVLRAARGSRELRRRLVATRPLGLVWGGWQEKRAALMHLVFLLFSALLPWIVVRQAIRLGWMRGRRGAPLLSVLFPLLCAVGLLWVLEAREAERIGDALALGLVGLLLAAVSV